MSGQCRRIEIFQIAISTSMIFLLFLVVMGVAEASDRYNFEAIQVSSDGEIRGVAFVPIFTSDGKTSGGDSSTPVNVNVSGFPAKVRIAESSISETPLSIAIAVDTSGSMKRRLAITKVALTDFIHKLPPESRIALYSFNDLSFTEVRFGASREEIARSISELTYGGLVTVLYDAIMRALDDLSREETKRRVLVVVTDGKDENSSTTLTSCLSRAENLAIPIHFVGLGVKKEYERFLTEISRRSYGEPCFSPDRDPKKLAVCFDMVNRSLPLPLARLTFEGTVETPLADPGNMVDVVMTVGESDRSVTIRKNVQVDVGKKRSVQTETSSVLTLGTESLLGDKGVLKKLPGNFLPITGIILLLIALIIFIIVYRRHSMKTRRCPTCGEEIPDYLDDCLACSGIKAEDHKDRTKNTLFSEQLRDTDPMIFALEDHLEKTLVLNEIPSLVQFRGNEVVATYDLTIMRELEAGRSENCGIVIKDKSVSTRHARIIRDNNEYFIADLDSTNGTFVNERRVLNEKVKLMFGDTIRMGQTTFMLKVDQRGAM